MIPESENRDEVYFQCYTEIKDLVLQAYADVYLLDEFEHYNDRVKKSQLAIPKCSFLVLKHICHLILADLGLTVWKITDTDSHSNTIVTMKSDLSKRYNRRSTYSYTSQTIHSIKILNSLRNECLAHNDIEKRGNSISVSLLKSALNDIKGHLNDLCYPEIDSRVRPLGNEMFKVAYDMKLGLEILLEGANMIGTSHK